MNTLLNFETVIQLLMPVPPTTSSPSSLMTAPSWKWIGQRLGNGR